MADAQGRFTEIQWTLSGEEAKLNKLLQAPNPEEQAVLAQMDRVLLLEQNMKRTQMTMLIRVKNVLHPDQQAALTQLQRGAFGPGGGGPGMGRGGRGGGLRSGGGG